MTNPLFAVLAVTDFLPVNLLLAMVLAVVLLVLFVGLARRYKRCPSNKVLVIYGKTRGGAARCIHGGAAFIWPLIVTNSWDMYTLPVGLSTFADEADVQWELVMTGAAISTIPTLIVFLIFQRFIIRGVVMAGLKG